MKAAFKSKTMWFALTLAILGVVEMQARFFEPYMTAQVFGIFNILIGVVVAVLRVLTTVPLDQK